MKTRLAALSLCLLASSGPASAEIGYYGWGPRVGVGDDPDQILVGIHQDLGEFVENLRFQPSLDLGLGDDHTVISGVVPVHYRFPGRGDAVPYLGGGLVLAWIDRDRPARGRGGGDDSEFDISPLVVGGVEWKAGRRGDALLEIQFATGDAHDIKLMFGWIFRAR